MTTAKLPAAADVTDLTAALRKSGALGDACVQNVSVESDRDTLLSRILRLRLTYIGAAPDAPYSVILKTGLARTMDPAWNGGRQEVAFYTQIGNGHCVATMWVAVRSSSPPNRAQCETILTARARLHAAWWDDPRLGVSVGERLDADGFDQYLRRLERHFATFADHLDDNLPPERRDLFERFLQAAPRLFARYRSGRNITIVQGDAHVWNCFLPRGGGNDVRLFDWDSWRIHIPTFDLAYMMADHWYPDRRLRMEQPLLDHYHAALLAHGVTGYDRRELGDDYRWSVLWQMATPVFQAANQIPAGIWWNNLERVLLAVDDLGCRELLA